MGLSLALLAGFGWHYLQPSLAETTNGPSHDQRAKGAGGPAVSVTTQLAEKTDFPVKKRSIGWIETPASVVVRPRIDSQIAVQHVVDGQMVKKGDLLFELDDREQQAQLAKDQAQLVKDQALLERIHRDLARATTLRASGAGTQQAVDQATADAKSAEASIQADKAAIQNSQVKLSYTKIYAPIDGRVGAVQVTPGNLVSANSTTALVTITQIDPVRVTFTMPERELSAIRSAVAAGTPPEVRIIPSGSKTPTAKGVLNFFDSNIDMMSGTVTLKAPVPNADLALWPGQYVDIDLYYAPLRDMTVVPSVAVESGQDSPYLYVVKPDSTVELRKVTVAATDGDRTAIATGLAAGERVVVDGQAGLSQGARVRDPGIQRADAGHAATAANRGLEER
jgi:multidrug efflux system membrane fusion protein